MSFLEKTTTAIKENLSLGITAAILTSLSALFAFCFSDSLSNIPAQILAIISPKQSLALLGISILINIGLLAFIFSYRKKITELTELTPEGSVYRDIKGNAYCPIHKLLMSPYNQKNEYYFCHSCNKSYGAEYKNELPDSFSI
jgi:hypothetical protein